MVSALKATRAQKGRADVVPQEPDWETIDLNSLSDQDSGGKHK